MAKLPEYWRQVKSRPRGCGMPRTSSPEEAPPRAEQFSADQMAQHGAWLTASHRISADPPTGQVAGATGYNR